MLPRSLIELTLTEHRLRNIDMSFCTWLTNLATLDVGEISRYNHYNNYAILNLARSVPGMQGLRRLRLRYEEVMSFPGSRYKLWSALAELPAFEEFDHGPDPRGLWMWDTRQVELNCVVPDGINFRLKDK